jgi:hypothetical protein
MTRLERWAQFAVGTHPALKPSRIEQYRQILQALVPEFDGCTIEHVTRWLSIGTEKRYLGLDSTTLHRIGEAHIEAKQVFG